MKIAVTRGFENEIDIKSDFSTIWRLGTVWRRNGAGLFVKEHSTQLLHSEPLRIGTQFSEHVPETRKC